jgi:polysaccharide pyruvyl transferase WcaK-like protein
VINLFCIRPKGFNIGNDVIYLGMQHFVYEAFGQVVNLISLPATSRYESQAKAGLTAKTIHEINQYGHGVIVGGGNLYENGELEVNLEALEALEVPLMLFSLGWGRMYNRHLELKRRTDQMPARTIVALNQRADYSLARDIRTLDYLRSLGCGRAQLGGCPTIFLDRMAERLPWLSPADRSGVLISVRTPGLMNMPLPNQSQIYGDIARIIEFLRGEKVQDIRLLCHDHRDLAFAASFPGVDYVYTDDIYAYLALLRSCALNISYRLHATLPCLAFGTPTIALNYDERAISLTETVGLGDWSINIVAADTVSSVIDRYRRLGDLRVQREAMQVRWAELYGAMLNTFRAFADQVRSAAGQTRR